MGEASFIYLTRPDTSVGRPKGFMGGHFTMAQLDGIVSKLNGSAGQLTFRRVKGRTLVSEKATTVTNKRTTAQQKHRMKWPNLIKMYSGIAPLLNLAFEDKPQTVSDYNMFVKVNFQASKVYLTKSEAACKACVAAPYQISMGSLESINISGTPGASVTDIALGSLVINGSTTVKEFSMAVVLNNKDFDFGDQISFIRIEQYKNLITNAPQCKFYGEAVVLSKDSDVKLLDVVSADGFYAKGGFLACNLSDDFQGAYTWVHSRQKNGNTLVSTQALEVKNNLYTEYSNEDAYKRAVETYGGEHRNFLTPTSPQPSPKGEGGQTGGGGGTNPTPNPSTGDDDNGGDSPEI